MIPHWLWLSFITAVGACVGSFLNVVVYRLPAGLSVVSPPSRCPNCEKKLAAYDNVPVLGWLWLRGKCRYCKNPISIQYPLVEAFTAALFAGAYFLFYMAPDWRTPLGGAGYGFAQTFPLFVTFLVMIAGLLAATLIDARHYIIPLSIPWVITVVALIAIPLGSLLDGNTLDSYGKWIGYEPFVPVVGPTGAMVAWGGAAGLVIGIVLLRLGILPDSFEGEEDEALDENGELPPLKRPRIVALKELLFVGLPLLGMLVGHFMVSRDMIEQPGFLNAPWYYVLAGCVLGYLVGGGLIWLIRIFGTIGFGKEAMGLGDVHLLGAIGAVIGWHESVFVCIFIAPFLGLFITILLKLLSSVSKRLDHPIPYGPYLAAGALILLVLGSERMDLVELYAHFLSGPGRDIEPLFVP